MTVMSAWAAKPTDDSAVERTRIFFIGSKLPRLNVGFFALLQPAGPAAGRAASGVERASILGMPAHLDLLAGLQFCLAQRVAHLHHEVVGPRDLQHGPQDVAHI